MKMVLEHEIQNLFDLSSKTVALNLPSNKPNGFQIRFKDDTINNVVYSAKEPLLPFAASEVFDANIASWRRLTTKSNDCKAVYEVTFNIKGSNLKFRPGDTIGILPQNEPTDVNTIIEHLDLTSRADWSYELVASTELKGAKVPAHIPLQSTLRHVLTHCVDVRSVLKKVFLLALSRHTKDEQERRVLEFLCSREGSTVYNTYVLNKGFGLIHLFNVFKSCVPPIEVLILNLPRLLPRPYSIVNSQLSNENELKICFSVLELENKRKGLTTGYLENIILMNDIENRMKNLSISIHEVTHKTIPIYLRKNVNGFLMPEDITKPMLLIATGTGVAPYMGFLQERAELNERDATLSIGETWLLFGCRDPKLDYLYEKEILEFLSNGVLTKISIAKSRVDGAEAKYVQDVITSNVEDIATFIDKGATIFVCGDLKTMCAQVRDCIRQALAARGAGSERDADTHIAQLERDGRYLVDIWS